MVLQRKNAIAFLNTTTTSYCYQTPNTGSVIAGKRRPLQKLRFGSCEMTYTTE